MTRVLVAIAATASMGFLSASVPQAKACGFDGAMSDSFALAHPKSMDVAFAISDAVAQEILQPANLPPSKAGQQGYWKAVDRVNRFQSYLPATASKADVSILLVDSQMWSRFKVTAAGYEVIAHTDGPATGDIVVVTAEPVLTAMLDGALPLKQAIETGVLAIDGERESASQFATALVLRSESKPVERQLMLFMARKQGAQ